LLATWFPATAQGLTAQALSQPGNDWIELQLLHKSQNGDRGAVEFNAWYRDDDGQPAVLHEKSVFTRSGGRWYYVGGEVEAVPG
jgi:SEC-C motif-containing protein